MNLNNSIKDGQIAVFLDSRVYKQESILKCLYWYSDKFNTSVDLLENQYRVCLSPNSQNQNINLEETYDKLLRDLLDYNLRQIVTNETKNIRDLLIAKAFSNGEFDETPPGEISDPVGFSI